MTRPFDTLSTSQELNERIGNNEVLSYDNLRQKFQRESWVNFHIFSGQYFNVGLHQLVRLTVNGATYTTRVTSWEQLRQEFKIGAAQKRPITS